MIVGLALAAYAQRPTEGGLYSFDDTDDVQSWDEPTGRVRVHFSVDGPNEVKSGDADADGVPDFAAEVALRAAEVLAFDAAQGLRSPITEAEMGLGPLGGSDAFDFYLVDFGGDADGMFGVDRCTDQPHHCSGYMVMENDFRGYGYPSLSVAITVLTSHELFHAVQAAYDAGQPVWFSEGTAVWAEEQFDPESKDFRGFADAYLDDAGRSLDRPPTGPVPAFAYGTGLFWDWLTRRHDAELMNELLDATESTGEPVDTIAVVQAAIEGRGDTLDAAWTAFADADLATGDRAGSMESHPYASELGGITAEAEGASIDDDNRFYPLAATYYRLDYHGGELFFGAVDDATAVRFALHPVANGDDDGPVAPALAEWTGEPGVQLDLGDQPAGGYWLVGTYPQAASESTKTRFCLGTLDAVEACVPTPADTDVVDTDEPRGCGCDSGGQRPVVAVLLALAMLRGRYRRGR